MQRLQTIHQQLVDNAPYNIRRYLIDEIEWDKQLISITGARGSGKTTLLLQHIKENFGSKDDKVLYTTLDDIYFEKARLIEFAEDFVKKGGTHLYLDEVHKYPHWSKDLKLMYDYYPTLKVVFTGSSALNIYKGDSDLSRRAVGYTLSGLSFRAYLRFEHGLILPKLTLDQILYEDRLSNLPEKIDILQTFKAYLQWGFYPFFLEGKNIYSERLRIIANLVLETDLPAIQQITYQTIHKLKRLLSILTAMVPFTPNITQLAREVGVARDILLNYISWLERASMIQTLRSASKGMGPLRKPDKIFLNNPNLCYALGDNTPDRGNLRETFFMNQLSVKHQVTTPKYGDFLVDNSYVFEVGGASKTFSQLKGVPSSFIAADDILHKKGRIIPLWHFGFTY